MKSPEEIARQICDQWQNHDRFRLIEGESNDPPEEVYLAVAYLFEKELMKQTLMKIRECATEQLNE